MSYPWISIESTRELTISWFRGGVPLTAPHVRWLGAGDEIELAAMEETEANLHGQLRASDYGDADRDEFEGAVGESLAEVLQEVTTDVLDDPGFWRYLAIEHFW